MKKSALTFIFLSFSICLSAGKLEKAFEALEQYNYFEAKDLFQKSIEKDSVPAAYGLSIIYARNDNPFYNLDSAYKYIQIADTAYFRLEPKEILAMNELYVDSMSIENWKDTVDEKVYLNILKTPSVEAWGVYMQKHQDSKRVKEAEANRDVIAFELVKQKNTAAAYQKFGETYPNAKQATEAKNLYELRLYQEQTYNNRLAEYQNFVRNYPNSPYLLQAQDSVYAKSIPHKTIQEYYNFITANPSNRNIAQAWRNLYKLYMSDYSPERIIEFRIDYPNYPFVEDLVKDIKLAQMPFFPFQINGNWGFMDTTGLVRIKPAYESVEPFSEGLALVVKNGKLGYIDKSGEIIIPLEYEDGESFSNGVAVVMKNDYYGLINKTNRLLAPFEYEIIGPFDSDLAVVANDTAYGFINLEGEISIPLSLDFADDFKNGFALIEQAGKRGIINNQGKLIVPIQYQWLENFNQYGLARAKNDSLFGVINQNGSEVLPFLYNRIGEFSEERAMIVKEDKYGYADLNGRVVIEPNYTFKVEALLWGRFQNGSAKFLQKQKFGIIDTSGEKLYPAIFEDVGSLSKENLTAVKKRGQWGYSNDNLNLVIPYDYDLSKSFIGNYGLVMKEGKWGMLNQEGEEILKIEYDQIEFITDSLYKVKSGNLWSLYKPMQETPMEFKWDKIVSFSTRYLTLYKGNNTLLFDTIKREYLTPSF